MWIWLLRSARTYAPYITLPFAAAVGFIGYNLEALTRGPSPPARPSIKDERNERLLGEILDFRNEPRVPLQEEINSPHKTIFDKNVSPSLEK